jgi:hypothetical protein
MVGFGRLCESPRLGFDGTWDNRQISVLHMIAFLGVHNYALGQVSYNILGHNTPGHTGSGLDHVLRYVNEEGGHGRSQQRIWTRLGIV